MAQKERITSLIASMGYMVSACSEKADLITTLFYHSDHIYQLECFTGDWIVFGCWEQHTMMTGIIPKPEDR